jgi:glyoxylase-like metal-dependent hydrolase (beta-lactamase superfamily II)
MSKNTAMNIKAFYDKATATLTYVVFDELSRDAVIIDPVLDFDAASGRLTRSSVDEVIAFAKGAGLHVRMVLETHAHADHISSSQILKETFPGVVLAVGEGITAVQRRFAPMYGLPASFRSDGSQFDRLLGAGEMAQVGSLEFEVRPTPGHTEACSSYRFNGVLFTGDALFMPDYGTGRCDFPGGSAERLYDSITRQIYTLPDETRVMTGHDYMPGGRELRYEASVGEQKRANIQLAAGTTREAFVSFRKARDATLAAPKLLHPSVQINIDAGRLPAPEANGKSYVKTPLTIAWS